MKNNIDILITGIGTVFTVYQLTKTLNKNRYDFILNVGICGSFRKYIEIGEAVNIISEEFANLGIQSENDFKTLFDLNFIKKNQFPFTNGLLINNYNIDILKDIKKVAGITVSSVSGNINQINQRIKKFNSDVETMEGAALFYVCLNERVPFMQLRTVSNYIEVRNKENWNIPKAISTLHKKIISLFLLLQ